MIAPNLLRNWWVLIRFLPFLFNFPLCSSLAPNLRQIIDMNWMKYHYNAKPAVQQAKKIILTLPHSHNNRLHQQCNKQKLHITTRNHWIYPTDIHRYKDRVEHTMHAHTTRNFSIQKHTHTDHLKYWWVANAHGIWFISCYYMSYGFNSFNCNSWI